MTCVSSGQEDDHDRKADQYADKCTCVGRNAGVSGGFCPDEISDAVRGHDPWVWFILVNSTKLSLDGDLPKPNGIVAMTRKKNIRVSLSTTMIE